MMMIRREEKWLACIRREEKRNDTRIGWDLKYIDPLGNN
jgi:hypothetical protein